MWAVLTPRIHPAAVRLAASAVKRQKAVRFLATHPEDPASNDAAESAFTATTPAEAAAKVAAVRPKTKQGALLERQRVRAHLRRLLPKFEATGTIQTTSIKAPQMLDDTSYNLTLEKMMAAGMHLGHSASLWNPMNLPYIFGERQGVHIINLEHTMAALRRAAHFVERVAYHGGLILFVGTRKDHQQLAVDAALHAEQYFIMGKWLPGTLTNPRPLLGRNLAYASEVWDVPEAQDYVDIELKAKSIENNGNGGKFGSASGGGKNRFLAKMAEDKARLVAQRQAKKTYKPDIIVALNPLQCRTMLAESQLALVPTVGIVDTNCDPRCVTYPIPCNDDSLRGVTIVAGVLAHAARDGLNRRREQLLQAVAKQRKADIDTAADRNSSRAKFKFD
ncbi:hypothetical protein GGI20_003065 [Coemansia sp. BCRC 34301]|nr:hypothetical protein GGI20_003065 [Coemansia sp. BCRC 34301]